MSEDPLLQHGHLSGASSQGAVWPLHASRSNCSDVSARLCNERASLLPGLLSGWLFLQRCLKERGF
ncbi:hypothetical protein ALQ90_03544 [Pseudomonas savastanoi pv. savastanoi]|nr:hypothetical protein ALQ90_03544 [Pseudomonas savastanoi pv. savastanoi]